MPATSGPPLVLVVEDDPGIAELIADVLDAEGIAVARARTLEEAALVIEGERLPDAIMLDLLLGGSDGTEFYRDLLARGIHIPALLVSGHMLAAERAAAIGARYIAKPFDVDELARAVREVVGLDESALPAR